MKRCLISIFLLHSLYCTAVTKNNKPGQPILFTADNPKIQYIGRIDFSNPQKPRFWAPGVYIVVRFKGSSCQIMLNDEGLNDKTHNYIEIAIDDRAPLRIQTTGKTNIINPVKNLSKGTHTITICKATESGIGYLEFVGIQCESLLSPTKLSKRKIEYIGDSITCGSSMDVSTPCNVGQWYDHNNAYLSYGALTARNLNAQYHLTSISGIGLIHSCCNNKMTMPKTFDKINLRSDTIQWDFRSYQPDVVTVCLGQNDGIQDSTLFCSAYVAFIHNLRSHYPNASIICLTSPMAEQKLTIVVKKYITAVANYVNVAGDSNVSFYFFTRRFYHGCGTHPDIAEHREIAEELTAYIKNLKKW
jgi:hypothetical protein